MFSQKTFFSIFFFSLVILNPIPAFAYNEVPGDTPCSTEPVAENPCAEPNYIGYERTPIIADIRALKSDGTTLAHPTKIGTASVVVPYVNEYGSKFNVKVTFSTGVWEMTNESGTIAGGILEEPTLFLLQEATLGLINGSGTAAQKNWWQESIGWIIDGIGILVGIDPGPSEDEIARQAAIDAETCANQISSDLARAYGQAYAACPPDPTVREDGAICQNTPVFSGSMVSENPAACHGGSFVSCYRSCN